jgi:hypothetical protein
MNGKYSLGGTSMKWKHNIKMDLRGMEWEKRMRCKWLRTVTIGRLQY